MLVRHALRTLNAFSSPLQAILCAVGYEVLSNLAASISVMILPSPVIPSMLTLHLLNLAAIFETQE